MKLMQHKNGMYYVHPDHLGSFSIITDAAGNLKQKCTFDAWGKRTFVTSDNTLIFDRGFTGHEHYDEFNLINMNGRMYDPIVGRFLSVDNVVQDPFYTQSFNRYSYCINNPLKYSDPTGMVWMPKTEGLFTNDPDDIENFMSFVGSGNPSISQIFSFIQSGGIYSGGGNGGYGGFDGFGGFGGFFGFGIGISKNLPFMYNFKFSLFGWNIYFYKTGSSRGGGLFGGGGSGSGGTGGYGGGFGGNTGSGLMAGPGGDFGGFGEGFGSSGFMTGLSGRGGGGNISKGQVLQKHKPGVNRINLSKSNQPFQDIINFMIMLASADFPRGALISDYFEPSHVKNGRWNDYGTSINFFTIDGITVQVNLHFSRVSELTQAVGIKNFKNLNGRTYQEIIAWGTKFQNASGNWVDQKLITIQFPVGASELAKKIWQQIKDGVY